MTSYCCIVRVAGAKVRKFKAVSTRQLKPRAHISLVGFLDLSLFHLGSLRAEGVHEPLALHWTFALCSLFICTLGGEGRGEEGGEGRGEEGGEGRGGEGRGEEGKRGRGDVQACI